jgi:hypothetical protein
MATGVSPSISNATWCAAGAHKRKCTPPLGCTSAPTGSCLTGTEKSPGGLDEAISTFTRSCDPFGERGGGVFDPRFLGLSFYRQSFVL